MRSADLLVIGGGIVGLCAAIRGAQAGSRVLIVDAGVNAGTNTNAGSLHVQLQSRFMRVHPEQAHNVEASLPLYRRAVAEWERLESLHGNFELVRKGGLMLAEDAAQLSFLEEKARREASFGLDVEILDRRDLDALAPWLGPQIIGAELCRDEGKLNPLLANARLRELALNLGVSFVTDRVVSLSTDNPMHTLGENGQYAAEQIIVAAAWGAGELLSSTGLSLPGGGEPLHMNITEPAAATITHLVQHAERSITLKQLHSGQIVIGGGWPAVGRGDDAVPGVMAESLLGNVALAGQLVPAIQNLRVIRSWAGMNSTTDGKSVLGRLPKVGRVIAALPGDAGYTLGPLVGRLAAEVAIGEAPDFDISPYSPARFAQ